jgi:RNA polymerase sigma-70 factor (ECF subfamily)
VQPDDDALYAAWRGGDSKAGVQLFERHYPAVARFFRNKVDDDAGDLVQKTFLACLEGKERIRGDSSFRTYLFAVAHNVLYKHLRGKVREGARLDFGLTSVHDLQPTPVSLLARRREERLLLLGLRRIPLDHQVLLELYFWEKLPAREIADILGTAEGTIRTRLRRARQLLEEAMIALAASADELRDTLGNLDAWADAVRPQTDA